MVKTEPFDRGQFSSVLRNSVSSSSLGQFKLTPSMSHVRLSGIAETVQCALQTVLSVLSRDMMTSRPDSC